jgi:hypothetical protein
LMRSGRKMLKPRRNMRRSIAWRGDDAGVESCVKPGTRPAADPERIASLGSRRQKNVKIEECWRRPSMTRALASTVLAAEGQRYDQRRQVLATFC